MITRKRKLFLENETNKKCKIDIDWNTMISPSSIRNYLLNDPLLDWFKYYNITSINQIPIKRDNTTNLNFTNISNNNSDFINYIMEQGIIFEQNVYMYLCNNFKNKYNIVKVAESYEARSYDKFLETVECMKKGVDIIYQGVLHDYKNKIYGCPDLLIRSDKLKDIFKDTNFTHNNKPANKLNLNFHYVVIDIKHSTLYMASNNINLLNNNSIPAYKGQIYLYTKALGEIQGYTSKYGYILGKLWTCTKNNKTIYGYNFLDKLGTLDFENYDNMYINMVKNAINWVLRVRNEGYNWRLLPLPTIPELYPNMKNEKDGIYRKLKNDLNNIINEITSVWMCGYKKRLIAHEKKIYSWKDKRCVAKNLGFNNGKIAKTLDKILNINRQQNKLIDFGTIKKDNNWRNFGDDILEIYIDFESINSNFGHCVFNGNDNYIYNTNDIIFMIGIGWVFNNEYKYKVFIIKQNNIDSEYEMINEFYNFIDHLLIETNKRECIYIHWSNAEPIHYNKLLKRHNNNMRILNFFDLYKLFYDNNIIINGALNFSLKTIAKAMNKHKMINTVWDNTNPCSDGLNAMLYAFKLYKNNNNVNIDEPTMRNIIHYNYIDCKVLYEIIQYLRKSI
jgi:hypothetical protein